MIPKQIFFIWIGDRPDYVDFSLNSFKEMNPNFCVDLIYYNKNQIVNSHDSVLNYCKDLIFKTHDGIDNKYFKFIKSRINSKFNFIQILCDMLRFELLYYYGGIYLDCDTFPVKPFDEELLSHNCFGQSVMCFRNKKYNVKNFKDDNIEYYDCEFIKNPLQYHCYTYTDIYFFGTGKEFNDKDILLNDGLRCSYNIQNPWIKNIENTKSFKNFKDRFYNCELELYKDVFYYSDYIIHFPNRNWKNKWQNNSLYCEYDDYLYL